MSEYACDEEEQKKTRVGVDIGSHQISNRGDLDGDTRG